MRNEDGGKVSLALGRVREELRIRVKSREQSANLSGVGK